MRRVISALLVLVPLSAICMGQAKAVDVFGGFSWLSHDLSLTNPNGTGPIGWNASATFPVRPKVGVVVDFSGYYPGFNFGCGAGCTQSAKVHSFLLGPQTSRSQGRVQPFARFLIGATHMTTSFNLFLSDNSFTFGAGGGADFRLTHRFALRGQVDWLHNGFHTEDNQLTHEEVHNLACLSTGFVIHF